jgi:hypothetical protein
MSELEEVRCAHCAKTFIIDKKNKRVLNYCSECL